MTRDTTGALRAQQLAQVQHQRAREAAEPKSETSWRKFLAEHPVPMRGVPKYDQTLWHRIRLQKERALRERWENDAPTIHLAEGDVIDYCGPQT